MEYLGEKLREIRSPDDDRPITVEKRVRTDFGGPDIIIDDRPVLELKLEPHEGRRTGPSGSAADASSRTGSIL